MRNESALKIAAHMVAEYGHEGRFELELLDREETDSIAAAFTKLGCTVDRVPTRNWLVVSCARP